jgi:NAD kinase
MSFERIILVTRLTRLQENIRRFNTVAQTKFFIENRGQSFSDYQLEDDNYQQARDRVIKIIPKEIKVQVIDRSFLPNYLFSEKDLIVTLGQDGLVVNTAKYLNGQPVIGVNPDPQRFDGVLMPFQLNDLEDAVRTVLTGHFQVSDVTMGKVELNDGQSLYAFNDFFIGASSHISARYTLSFGEKKERQMSSGIIVSTPAGSTGWLSSVYNMASGISGNRPQPSSKKISTGSLNPPPPKKVSWNDEKLIFVVREPFASRWSQADLVTGILDRSHTITIESHMAEKGVIFSDGMENDYIEFNSGSTATVRIADRKTRLVTR